LANWVTDDAAGIQAGVISVTDETMRGVQVNCLSVASKMAGVQLSLVASVANDSMHGLQYGVFNSASNIAGVQIGFVNYCENISGIQVGLINIIKNGRVPFLPIINASF
jgi:hypothetical protein